MKYEFKVVIWGLGTNGKNLIDVLGEENVVAIIDSNREKVAEKAYRKIPLIDFETYLKKYIDYYIIVTPMKYHAIEALLKEYHISKYFIQNKCLVGLAVFWEIRKGRFLTNYQIDRSKKYYLEGVNLFSIYLYRHLQENGYEVGFVSVNAEQTMHLDKWKKDELIEEFYCEFEATDNICLIKTDDVDFEFDLEKVSVIDSASLNEGVYSKWRNNLVKYKDCHKGKRVFIIATGPSLKVEDVEMLYRKRELTISMNSIYYMFEKSAWRPNYYVASDGLMLREYEQLGRVKKEFDEIEKFFSDNYMKFWGNDLDDTYHGFHQLQNVEQIEFSRDFSEVVYSGATVVYACLQLAVYMGFRQIYLLGCDFNFSKGFNSTKDHFAGPVQKHYSFEYELVQRSYEKAKEVAESMGINIYNATRGGKLEVFPRVDFDTLF